MGLTEDWDTLTDSQKNIRRLYMLELEICYNTPGKSLPEENVVC